MNNPPEITVHFYNSSNSLIAITSNPRKIIIKSAFGAGKQRCWLELYNEDNLIPAALGCKIKVYINQMSCFCGQIIERRIDSIDDQLTFYAQSHPEYEYHAVVNQYYENWLITEILDDILQANSLTLITPDEFQPCSTTLNFVDYPIFTAIDLLAKLAGNWLWDIQAQNTIRFRPPGTRPDHYIHLHEDHYVVNLWQTLEEIAPVIEIRNNIEDFHSIDHIVIIPDLIHQPANPSIHVYALPIVTIEALNQLTQSIQEQMKQIHYEHYIDLWGVGAGIQPGDLIQFSVDNFILFPQQEIFRVKQRDLVYSHETLKTRLHVTTGYESSITYFHHIKHNPVITPKALLYHLGPFQLDVSRLDSAAHLDTA